MKSVTTARVIGLLTGPALCLIICLLPGDLVSPVADKVLGVAAWIVSWWITEAVSISVTALLPLLLFPLLGISTMRDVSVHYGDPVIFLFFGGFIIALAMEKVHLHKRIALSIIRLTGTSPNRVILGFMIATGLLSMWISNTATTLVMLPIAVSVIDLLRNDGDGFTNGDRNFALSIMLGIAYSANIGGVATLIGTPPNMVMAGFINQQYETSISFFRWMMLGIPFAIIMTAILYVVMVKWMYPNHLGHDAEAGKLVIRQELQKLGSWSPDEKRVMGVFLFAILLWTIREPMSKQFSWFTLSDTGVAMLAALLIFALPTDLKNMKFVLDWSDTKTLPWGILILFGGGLALADGMSDAGLIDEIGNFVHTLNNWPLWVISGFLILVVLFMTELMSNVALVTIFLPVAAGIASGLGIPFQHLLIPITMAASCAFMLPMATPPNAIVFASGHVKVRQMVRIGVVLNLISVLLLAVLAATLIPYLFG
ncbi:MAG TPA: DASS family sodium-coupled anion symporter [Chitinophagales bacterium]|nr:DASS family sodium-coupled anion symporter [Chitinophagales bacterium]HPR28210.1 DASS family sodium-coupled anion symporter [Chitinophagales bacterium]HRX23753.1 DASS family sodium-coupled anion symporter [Chitinophagales bacterium]